MGCGAETVKILLLLFNILSMVNILGKLKDIYISIKFIYISNFAFIVYFQQRYWAPAWVPLELL